MVNHLTLQAKHRSLNALTNTSITAAQCVKDQEPKTDSDGLSVGKKSSPENCFITIIKNHQEAIR
jgi:hypothetical protein